MESHPLCAARLCFRFRCTAVCICYETSSLVEKPVYCAEKHSQGIELKSDFTSLENGSAAHVMDCSWTINHGLGISDAISLVWARSLPSETVLKFQGHRTSGENDDPFPYRGTGPIVEI